MLDGADIDASITPAERQQHQDLVMHKAQALESAQPGGEGVDAGFSPDPSSRSRRVSFERGLEKGPAAAHGPAAAPIRKPSSERLDPQNWRWLLQQEELKRKQMERIYGARSGKVDRANGFVIDEGKMWEGVPEEQRR